MTGSADSALGVTVDSGLPINGFSVETMGYDNARSGSNLKETILNTSNVNAARFGLLFSRTIVGASYGQPLYVSGVTVGGVKRNIVYVATEENNVYAFDADNAAASAPIWQKNLGAALPLTSGALVVNCADMHGSNDIVGVTSTPVISVAGNTIFVVSKGPGLHHLHSLDLATGADVAGSPATIGAGMADFNSNIHLNRPGLLLLNGVVYVAFGSHCDNFSYHGWVFGYDAKTLQRVSAFNTTPTATLGAIWQSGAGLSSDGTEIFAAVGNGTGGYRQSIIDLKPGATMTVPHSFPTPAISDNDLQTGVLVIGDQVVAGGKDGDLWVLGKTQFEQRQKISLGNHLHWLAAWNGSAGQMVYTWVEGSTLRAFKVGADGQLTAAGATSTSGRRPAHPGGIFSISSNGTLPGTGVLWASIPDADAWHQGSPGGLFAYDASDISKAPLWDSQSDVKDDVGIFAKFSPPTVANGKVYLATFSGKLQVYGLK